MTGTDVVPAGQAQHPVGTEDEFDNDVQSLPRYRVVGKVDALNGGPGFVNESAGIAVSSLNVIVLGSIKGRVLWSPEMPEDSKGSLPYCKSLDGFVGRPDMGEPDREPPRAGAFPWKAVPPELKATLTEDGTIKCGDCPLKDWGSHPTQDKPWCAEQSTWLFQFPEGDQGALVTFQRSSLKAAQKYIEGFRSEGNPMFTVMTTITLEQRQRGTVTYAVPSFKRGEVTAQDDWAAYSSEYLQVRAYLHTPREPREESAVTSNTAVVAAKPGDVPVAGFGDGELPF